MSAIRQSWSLHVSGVDPDLLVFGKHFTSNVRVLPHHYSRVNASEPLPSDKRQFIHPPPPAVLPLTSAATAKPPITGSRVLATTTTAQLLGVSQPATSATASLSTAPQTVTGNQAQTATPTTSVASPTPSYNTPLSSTAAATLSRYDAQSTPAFPSTTAQPSTSVPSHYYTSTFSQSPSGSPASTATTESSKQHSTNGGVSGEDTSGALGPGWHVAAHSLTVAVVICVTVLLSCCCSVLLFVSWRGQRKRMGRYHTSWRGKKGSMRLIKYVLVRESSWKNSHNRFGINLLTVTVSIVVDKCFQQISKDVAERWNVVTAIRQKKRKRNLMV